MERRLAVETIETQGKINVRLQVVDLRQTAEYAEYLRLIGWQVARMRSFLYIKKLPLLSLAVAKLQRPVKGLDWVKVNEVCRKYKVIALYFEPFDFTSTTLSVNAQARRGKPALQKLGFRECKDSYLPKKTIWIDLRPSEAKLLQAMKAKTRYNIGKAKRKKLKVKIIDGSVLIKSDFVLGEFFELLRKNARRLRIFGIPQKWFEAQVEAFGGKCFAVLAYFENKLVAGNFLMTSKNGCFYAHNGSTKVGRKLKAPSLCVWEGIREAKRRNLRIFDFEGIDDGSRALRRWGGFTRFKRGFGGEEIEFPTMQMRWLWPF